MPGSDNIAWPNSPTHPEEKQWALTLEITRPDADVISKLVHPGVEKHFAQPGEKYRLVDGDGQIIDGLMATREGQNSGGSRTAGYGRP